MEVNKLHQDLKQLYQGEDTKYTLAVEFGLKDEVKKIMTMFQKGYWSVMPFGFDRKDIFAVSLTPEILLKKSPIIRYSNISKVCKTFAPDLKSIIPMSSLGYIDEKEIFVETKEDIENIIKQGIAFQKYVHGEKALDFFKSYLLNEDNLTAFETSAKIKDKFYVDFWNHYNPVPEQQKTINLLQELLDDPIVLPPFQEEDYGVWNTYIYNVLAGRASSKLKKDLVEKWQYYWRSVQQPHGIDAMDSVLTKYEPSLKHSYGALSGISSFNSSWKEEYEIFPEEVRKHPIFHATESIRIKGDNYLGEEHLLAAGVLDEEYNDPIGAWNALISAGYWAGRKQSPAVEIVWKAGIHLAEKHNWTEIHEVLVQQYEYYNFYKDKV